MEYNKYVADFAVGDEIEGCYVLKTAQSKVSNNGRPFLAGVLADRSGAIEMKVWDYSGPVGGADEGKIVKVRGSVSEYRGAYQFIAGRIRLAREDDQYNLDDLVPVAPMDAEAAYRQIEALVESLADRDYRALCRKMLDAYGQSFKDIPAGKSVHHSFIHGLLMHTANMLRIADFLAGLYPDAVNRSLLLTGTLLHDFAKSREFTLSPLGLVTDYSTAGQLLGHLVMGAQWAADAARDLALPEEKSILLQHMILSHHGDPAFGAAVRPACAESELLSLIDLVDSRMEIYRETLEATPAGQFSKRVLALDNKKLYHHALSEQEKGAAGETGFLER